MLGETYWIVNAKGDGWICGYSTGQPRDPDGMRGHAWGT